MFVWDPGRRRAFPVHHQEKQEARSLLQKTVADGLLFNASPVGFAPAVAKEHDHEPRRAPKDRTERRKAIGSSDLPLSIDIDEHP